MVKRRYGYGGLNDRRKAIQGDWCVYCGDVATTRDHFPPACVTPRGWLLPCCAECNSVIGDREPHDLRKRQEIMLKRLGRKLGRFKAEWRNSEVEEQLGGNLRRMVRRHQFERRLIVTRLKWSLEAYLQQIAGDEARQMLGARDEREAA